MDLRTLALATWIAGAAGAAPGPGPAAALQGEGAVGAYLAGAEEPGLYVELFDLGRLERDARSSGLGRLGGLFLPVLEEHLDLEAFEALNEHLGFDPAALVRGETSCEDALALALITLAREHLGLERDAALAAVAALGTRYSLAVDARRERVAVSWSLRAGGQEVLAELLAAHPAGGHRVPAARLLSDAREAGGGLLYSLSIGGEPVAFLALRPDLIALCSEVEWGALLARMGGRAQVASGLGTAREEALRSGAPLWAWASGDFVRACFERQDQRAALAALGLDGVRTVELRLGADRGQLTSRLRLRLSDGERRGLLALARGGRARWNGLERLTTDTFAVVGLGRAPADVARELVELVERIPGAPPIRALWDDALQTPLLAELLTSGATGDEAVFFVRPGAAGLPAGYLALPAGEEVVERLGRLQDGARGPAGEARLRVKQIDGHPCWLLARGAGGLAVTHSDGALIAAQSLLALQDYLRRREREEPEDRAQLVADLRAQLGHSREAAGRPEARLAAFAHVRTEPLCEAVWPWVLLGASMTGAEGLEDLPDAFEIAEQIGDTTLLLFDDGDALELRGRGLFAGLGVVF